MHWFMVVNGFCLGYTDSLLKVPTSGMITRVVLFVSCPLNRKESLMTHDLHDDRIRLRPFQSGDLPVMRLLGQSKLYHYDAGFAHIRSDAEARQVLQTYMKRPDNDVIERRSDHAFLGFVELNERGLDERSGLDRTRELGFLLQRPYWGYGYMTAALCLLLDDAFLRLNLTEVWAGHYENNHRSAHLLQKIGFQYKYDVSLPFPFLGQEVEKYYLLTPKAWYQFRENNQASPH